MRVATLVTLALATAACSPGDERAAPLSGTAWRLVEIQSPDDAIGTVRPDDPAKYTMALNADGKAELRLNCNRGMATWTATGDGKSGGFTFGPMGMTKVRCPPPSLDTQIAKDAEYVRSYVLEGNRLHLSLMADGGIYVWEKTAP